MFFEVNWLYVLQVCLPGPSYFSVYWEYAMTYYVISWSKQSDDCILQISVRLITCYQ